MFLPISFISRHSYTLLTHFSICTYFFVTCLQRVLPNPFSSSLFCPMNLVVLRVSLSYRFRHPFLLGRVHVRHLINCTQSLNGIVLLKSTFFLIYMCYSIYRSPFTYSYYIHIIFYYRLHCLPPITRSKHDNLSTIHLH